MTVGLKLGCITDEVGRSDFFHSFFSTVSGNLEPEGWGTRFPVLLRSLYGGQLVQRDASTALFELQTVEKELSFLSAEKVIWNIALGRPHGQKK